MKKLLIPKYVHFDFDWAEVTLEKLKEDIKRLEELGVTEISISKGEIEAFAIREETDAEFEERKRKVAERLEREKKMEEENDKKEWERLKIKYGN